MLVTLLVDTIPACDERMDRNVVGSTARSIACRRDLYEKL